MAKENKTLGGKKRAKSIKDIQAQLVRIENGYRQRGTFDNITPNNPTTDSERFARAWDKGQEYIRNINNSQAGREFDEKESKLYSDLLQAWNKMGKDALQEAANISRERSKNFNEFFNRKFSYSTRAGING